MNKAFKFSSLLVLSFWLTAVYIFITPAIHTLGSFNAYFWLACFSICAGVCALWFKWCDPKSPMKVLPFVVIVAMIVFEFGLAGLETTRGGILAHGLTVIMWIGNIVLGFIIIAEPRGLAAIKRR